MASNSFLKKWLPLLVVVLFALGAIMALLYLPEQTQGPAGRRAALPPPAASGTHGSAILPRDPSDDELAPRPPSDDEQEPEDEPVDPNHNILNDDQNYPTPFAPPDQDKDQQQPRPDASE